MSSVFVPTAHRAGKPGVTPETIQKMLDENSHLIKCIVEHQQKGRIQECAEFQRILHRNLVWLATVADSNQSNSQNMFSSSTPTNVGKPQQGTFDKLQSTTAPNNPATSQPNPLQNSEVHPTSQEGYSQHMPNFLPRESSQQQYQQPQSTQPLYQQQTNYPTSTYASNPKIPAQPNTPASQPMPCAMPPNQPPQYPAQIPNHPPQSISYTGHLQPHPGPTPTYSQGTGEMGQSHMTPQSQYGPQQSMMPQPQMLGSTQAPANPQTQQHPVNVPYSGYNAPNTQQQPEWGQQPQSQPNQDYMNYQQGPYTSEQNQG